MRVNGAAIIASKNELRQDIEKQLNKIESANKFAKAVAFGHSEEMSQGEKDEQEIAEAARRFIKNAIICWNYLYLTQKLTQTADETAQEELLTPVKEGGSGMAAHQPALGV